LAQSFPVEYDTPGSVIRESMNLRNFGQLRAVAHLEGQPPINGLARVTLDASLTKSIRFTCTASFSCYQRGMGRTVRNCRSRSSRSAFQRASRSKTSSSACTPSNRPTAVLSCDLSFREGGRPLRGGLGPLRPGEPSRLCVRVCLRARTCIRVRTCVRTWCVCVHAPLNLSVKPGNLLSVLLLQAPDDMATLVAN
jgi:hypothetical protein